jgi:hypothetical protein
VLGLSASASPCGNAVASTAYKNGLSTTNELQENQKKKSKDIFFTPQKGVCVFYLAPPHTH